ncbi:MAG TPA: methyl-accepting chemotaxis protein, partial [Terriglobales bacterium]|nr:methyl-accepting chemotaxis protein [Terriglobales bacterium]
MKTSIRLKLAAGFGAVIALTAVSSFVSAMKMRQIHQIEGRIQSVRIPSSLAAERLSGGVADAGFALRNLIIYGSDPALAAKYENARRAAWDKVFSQLDTLKKLGGEEDRALLARLEDDIRNGAYRIQLDVIPDFVGHSGARRRRGLAKLKAGAGLAAKVQADCAELNHHALAKLDEDNQKLNQAESATSATTVATALLVLVCGLAVAWFVSGQISRAMAHLTRRIGEIANGDLTGTVLDVTSRDEIGATMVNINQMQEKLRELLQSIASTAEHVASASEEISSSATLQAQGAETQTNQTTQVATAMQEMSSTVMQVSENSSKAAESSRRAAETARQGGSIVNDTLEKMRAIADSVSAT